MLKIKAALLLSAGLLTATHAGAATYVTPSGNAGSEGSTFTILPFGYQTANNTMQFLYGASILGGLTPGSVITSIGFRADSGAQTSNPALSFSDYSISLGGSTRAVGSLSTNMASNQAANTTLVRSGALSIPANTFATGGSPNAFTTLAFNTPFTYAGGDLLLSISFAGGNSARLNVDAVSVGGGVDSVAFGQAEFYNAPVVQFTTLAVTPAVPESATWAMMILGMGAVGFAMRRRQKVSTTVRFA